MLVHKTIWSARRKDLESKQTDHNEMIAVEIRPRPGHTYITISAYRWFYNDPSPTLLENIDQILTNTASNDHQNLLILGI